MRLKGWSGTKAQAKRLRREMSLPEVLLWRELRKQEVRWRKGHPAGPYTLDFYCAPALLAVEVDGEAHGTGDRPARDAERDGWLEQRGVLTLRIPAVEVLRDLDAVMRFIAVETASRTARSAGRLRSATSPRLVADRPTPPSTTGPRGPVVPLPRICDAGED